MTTSHKFEEALKKMEQEFGASLMEEYRELPNSVLLDLANAPTWSSRSSGKLPFISCKIEREKNPAR